MPSFNVIPTALRVPLFYAEVDPSLAATSETDIKRSLIIAQKISTGTADADTPIRITSEEDAATQGERGSHYHLMARKYLQADPFGELWGIPLDDSGTAVHGTIPFVITGPATADGTIYLYVGGQLVNEGTGTTGIAVTNADTATVIGDAIEDALGVNEAAAVTLNSSYPVTATNAAGTVTFLARNGGTKGNFDIRFNYRGAEGGEEYPVGVTLDFDRQLLASGANDPTIGGAITAMGDVEYDMIAHPWGASVVDTLVITAMTAEMDDSLTGRWGPERQIYGHVVSAIDAAYATLSALGNARNDPHLSILAIEACPNPVWEIAGAAAGEAMQSLRNDPARPLQGLILEGILAPWDADLWTTAERNILLYDGLATPDIRSGLVRIERLITTFQTDTQGAPSNALLDIQTLFTLAYILRDTKARITGKFGRHKLADDGTVYGPGQAIVTPSVIKGELIAAYRQYEFLGLVENIDTFISLMTVERSITDANRVDVLYPPDLINQFRILALLAQFRLQYSQAELAS